MIHNSYEKEFITLKRIGEGNFTYVDLVISKSTNSPYAVKRSKQAMTKHSERYSNCLDSIYRRRLLREIRMFEEVHDCPNLLQYYKSWQEDCLLIVKL